MSELSTEVVRYAIEPLIHRSILNDPTFQPEAGPDANTFRMVDLLLLAFEGKKSLLAPLG